MAAITRNKCVSCVMSECVSLLFNLRTAFLKILALTERDVTRSFNDHIVEEVEYAISEALA